MEATDPRPVLTTWTLTKPWPKGVVAGTSTVIRVALSAAGVNGPALNALLERATKKLTREGGVKPEPVIRKLRPARIVNGIEMICGGLTVAVAVGVARWVAVRVGVRVDVRVGVCTGVLVPVRLGVRVAVPLTVGFVVAVAVKV